MQVSCFGLAKLEGWRVAASMVLDSTLNTPPNQAFQAVTGAQAHPIAQRKCLFLGAEAAHWSHMMQFTVSEGTSLA